MVSKDSLKTYQLPKRTEIQRIAKQVYDSLTARSVSKSLETPLQRQQRIAQADEQFRRTATELSNMILAPAATTLNRKRIVIVADGVLQYIPFAALTKSHAAVAQPLVVQHELITLPSASTLAIQRRNLRGRKLAPQILAVLADPVLRPTILGWLKRRRQFARMLSRQHPIQDESSTQPLQWANSQLDVCHSPAMRQIRYWR